MRTALLFSSLVSACLLGVSAIGYAAQPVITQAAQQKLTPNQMLTELKTGNQRFVQARKADIDFMKAARQTAAGQYPGAIILSCIDSRVPPEIVFDQNVGNIFVTRLAANVLSNDVLGGMEFATKAAGAKLIVVMGHDACGAVRGACEDVRLGHLSGVLAKVKPALEEEKAKYGKLECNNPSFINAVAADNVRMVVKQITEQSPIIAQLVKAGKVKIVGAMYHLKTGQVTWLDS